VTVLQCRRHPTNLMGQIFVNCKIKEKRWLKVLKVSN
jgi:hypothetical protein